MLANILNIACVINKRDSTGYSLREVVCGDSELDCSRIKEDLQILIDHATSEIGHRKYIDKQMMGKNSFTISLFRLVRDNIFYLQKDYDKECIKLIHKIYDYFSGMVNNSVEVGIVFWGELLKSFKNDYFKRNIVVLLELNVNQNYYLMDLFNEKEVFLIVKYEKYSQKFEVLDIKYWGNNNYVSLSDSVYRYGIRELAYCAFMREFSISKLEDKISVMSLANLVKSCLTHFDIKFIRSQLEACGDLLMLVPEGPLLYLERQKKFSNH